MNKTVIKRIVDVLMILVLFLLMGFMVTGQELHEWFGTSMLLLMIIHNILNYKWYTGLKKGRYGVYRLVWATLNFLLLAALLTAAMSGIAMSGYVFSFLDLDIRMSFARETHLAAVYWCLVLMCLHLGLHWGMMMKAAGKMFGITEPNRLRRVLLRLAAAILALRGVEAWVRHDLFSYMTKKSMFAFFDFEQPVFLFFVDYLCIMVLWGSIAHYMMKLLQIFSKKNSSNWGDRMRMNKH